MQGNTRAINCDDVLATAQGRWYGILRHFGVEVGDGHHRACPVCGGKDRFRFDDKDGRGTWFCNQCGAGDGLKLLMTILKSGFVETCEEVARVVGVVDQVPVQPEQSASPEKLREVFKSSKPMTPGDPVFKYLTTRGLSNLPTTLRYGKCWEYETKQEQDTMLAVFSLADGEAVTLHRTFIKDGKKLGIDSPKKVMPPLKKMTGGAIRLFEPVDEMIGIAEGIETAIACHETFNAPVWAATTAVLLEAFEPPPGIKIIEVFTDKDENYTGQKAAYAVANRLAIKGYVCNVTMPKHKDFLDDLVKGAAP